MKIRLLWPVALALGLGSAAPRLHAQQSTPPVPSTQSAPKRRAIDIRGQAPAPEIVTVRPREIPQYSKRIIAPTLIVPPAAQRQSSTVVILPTALDVNPVPPKPR